MGKQALIYRLNAIIPSKTGICESVMPWVIYCHSPWVRINLSDRMVWVQSVDLCQQLAQHTDLFEDKRGMYWLRLKPAAIDG